MTTWRSSFPASRHTRAGGSCDRGGGDRLTNIEVRPRRARPLHSAAIVPDLLGRGNTLYLRPYMNAKGRAPVLSPQAGILHLCSSEPLSKLPAELSPSLLSPGRVDTYVSLGRQVSVVLVNGVEVALSTVPLTSEVCASACAWRVACGCVRWPCSLCSLRKAIATQPLC